MTHCNVCEVEANTEIDFYVTNTWLCIFISNYLGLYTTDIFLQLFTLNVSKNTIERL